MQQIIDSLRWWQYLSLLLGGRLSLPVRLCLRVPGCLYVQEEK